MTFLNAKRKSTRYISGGVRLQTGVDGMVLNYTSDTNMTNAVGGGQTWWWLVFVMQNTTTSQIIARIGNTNGGGILSCRLDWVSGQGLYLVGNGLYVQIENATSLVVGQINSLSVVIYHNTTIRAVLNNGPERVVSTSGNWPLVPSLGNPDRGSEPQVNATFYEWACFPNTVYNRNRHLKMYNDGKGVDLTGMPWYANSYFHFRFNSSAYASGTRRFSPVRVTSGLTIPNAELRGTAAPAFSNRYANLIT